jgi:flagellar hook-associated protein 1
MSLLSIGVTGLNASQLGMLTTQHNIANANTEGYNRQLADQATNVPVASGSGFIGQGTHVQTIRRVYDEFIVRQVNNSQTNASELETYYDEVKLIDNMLADPNSGLSPALQDFFRGVQQVAASPSSLPARQAMVSSTEALVARFKGLEQRLSEQYANVNGRLQSATGEINSLATQIADINERIVLAQASTGQPANDMLDQRDQLIARLNEQVRVTTVVDSDGSLNVFVGSGQQLVVGARSNTLAAQPSVADPERFTIALVNGQTSQELPDSVLTGGAIAGLLRFRAESLDKAANSLGRVASTMALTFNAQHALGQDLLGNVEGSAGFAADFFQISAPKVTANALNSGAPAIDVQFIDPPPISYNNGDFKVTYDVATNQYSATSARYGGGPWTAADLPTLLGTVEAATGAAVDVKTGNFVTDISLSDYRVQFDATGTSFSVKRISDNQTVVPLTAVGGGRLFFDGLSLDISTAAGGNDTFQIQPTREVARNLTLNTAIAADPRLIAAAGPARAAANVNNAGSGKIEVNSVQPGYTLPAAPMTLTYNGGNLSVSGATGGTVSVTAGGSVTTYVNTPPAVIPFTADAVISIDGLSFSLTGAPKNGDSFTIGKNINGVADSRNALLLGQLQTQDTVGGGSASFQSAYAQLVSDIGNRTREIQVTGEAQQALLDQAISAREARSGVNLDEEAANLIRFQQAYQASARMIDIGARLFDTLISIGR